MEELFKKLFYLCGADGFACRYDLRNDCFEIIYDLRKNYYAVGGTIQEAAQAAVTAAQAAQ